MKKKKISLWDIDKEKEICPKKPQYKNKFSYITYTLEEHKRGRRIRLSHFLRDPALDSVVLQSHV